MNEHVLIVFSGEPAAKKQKVTHNMGMVHQGIQMPGMGGAAFQQQYALPQQQPFQM